MSISPLSPGSSSSPIPEGSSGIKDFRGTSLESLINNLSAVPKKAVETAAQAPANPLIKLLNPGVSKEYLKDPLKVAVRQMGEDLKHIGDELRGTAPRDQEP